MGERIAMISLHTSPLATPGVGDAGGLNVYVAELAKRLGERGLGVDVFTRRGDAGVPVVLADPDDPAAHAIMRLAERLAASGPPLAGRALPLGVR